MAQPHRWVGMFSKELQPIAQREDGYFKSTEVIFALLDTIPRGGAAPGLRELTLDDQSLTKSATQAAEDFKAIEATYQRTR